LGHSAKRAPVSAAESPIEPKYIYLAMMRLKPWRVWPALSVSHPLTFSGGGVSGQLQLFVTAYGEQPTDALARSPFIWRFENWSKKRQVVGSSIIFEQGTPDQIGAEDFFTHAQPGEIDVVCGAGVDAQAEWLFHYLESLVYSAIASLSTSLGDTFSPVGPMTRKVKGAIVQGANSPPFGIEVRATQPLSADAVTAVLAHALRPFVTDKPSAERVALLSSAIRRFMVAELDVHRADRYIDYWLTCEFLTAQIKKGTPHSKLAEALAPHFGRPSKKGKATIEKAFRLHDLATLRNAILHNGVEDVPASDLSTMRDLASELIRQGLGLTPAVAPGLNKALADYGTPGTPRKR
jgi:hypothetical protein